MSYMIVSDSSSNVLTMGTPLYTTVPLKIVAGKEYVDNADLDLAGMMEDLRNHKGKSGSSCPNVGEWLEAFGDAQEVFCVTISKHLSGSYAAAKQAADTYMEEHPGRKVFIFDSLAVGPEMDGDRCKMLYALNYDRSRACRRSKARNLHKRGA